MRRAFGRSTSASYITRFMVSFYIQSSHCGLRCPPLSYFSFPLLGEFPGWRAGGCCVEPVFGEAQYVYRSIYLSAYSHAFIILTDGVTPYRQSSRHRWAIFSCEMRELLISYLQPNRLLGRRFERSASSRSHVAREGFPVAHGGQPKLLRCGLLVRRGLRQFVAMHQTLLRVLEAPTFTTVTGYLQREWRLGRS